LRLDPPEVETNLIWFEIDPEYATAKEVAALLKQRGILVSAAGGYRMRACTHLDVSASQAERAAETIRQVLASLHRRPLAATPR
jgi:threonine aldolase